MKCCFLMTLACAVPALGQMMYNPPAAGGAPAAPPASPPAVQPNAYQPSRQGDAKSLYGNELPFLNPQDGTVTINGTTLNMGSFREIEARFNKYLSQPEESTEDAKEYQKIFEKLHETLSMRKEKLVADGAGMGGEHEKTGRGLYPAARSFPRRAPGSGRSARLAGAPQQALPAA